MTSGALPTFVVIGAAKCATTALHHCLGHHPEIQVSRRKELRFFMDQPEPHVPQPDARPLPPGEWRRGVAWYRSWFEPAAPIRGEATPGYTSPRFADVADRMAAVAPGARLIYCVRDPVTRAVSQYRQAVSDRYETRGPALALAPESHYVQSSLYGDRLAPFLRHWPLERVLVVAQEDLAADPASTLGQVLEFLGVDPTYSSRMPASPLNVSARKAGLRWRALQALRRRPWWPRVAERAPRRTLPALDRLTTAGRDGAAAAEPPVPESVVESIREAVGSDAARFRALTGHPFASWSV